MAAYQGVVFTGGVGIVIILSCGVNVTCCVCVTCTYSGVGMCQDHSHHIFVFHKHHGKRTSLQCVVTDRMGMEACHGCSHGCIWHYTVNISIYGTELCSYPGTSEDHFFYLSFFLGWRIPDDPTRTLITRLSKWCASDATSLQKNWRLEKNLVVKQSFRSEVKIAFIIDFTE